MGMYPDREERIRRDVKHSDPATENDARYLLHQLDTERARADALFGQAERQSKALADVRAQRDERINEIVAMDSQARNEMTKAHEANRELERQLHAANAVGAFLDAKDVRLIADIEASLAAVGTFLDAKADRISARLDVLEAEAGIEHEHGLDFGTACECEGQHI